MAFQQFRDKHDPNARDDWTFRFRLSPGESILTALVQVVDSSSLAVDADTDLVIEAQAFGQISGTLWGVTAWISGGGASSAYYLRCRGETDASPISRKFDRTMKLACQQL